MILKQKNTNFNFQLKKIQIDGNQKQKNETLTKLYYYNFQTLTKLLNDVPKFSSLVYSTPDCDLVRRFADLQKYVC